MQPKSIQTKVQSFGRFLSNMVMPNIGAFIAWGLITALFIPTGWLPNKNFSTLVPIILTYLLPILLAYTGGKLVYKERGAVVGSIVVMGAITASPDTPMFLGAMILGPLGGYVIKVFDKLIDGKIKSGFEMLVNNFSAGIIGLILALIAYEFVAPILHLITQLLTFGVQFLISHNLLPLTSIFVEPGKILFLNNAINQGIFTPIGIQQAKDLGHSIFFLIEANPGPGVGMLLAYMFFGKGTAKQTAPSAIIIQFFGGIHEIYFPYVLMKPRLILALIAGGMTNVFILTIFKAGLIAPASPGSIFAVLLMTPKGSYIGVILSVICSAAVSFIISSILLKLEKSSKEDNLEEAQNKMKNLKNESKGVPNQEFDYSSIKKIIVACDAGMGSSAMGAGLLKKKLNNKNIEIESYNTAINDIPKDADLVITHKDLTPRAKETADHAHHLSLNNFLDNSFYDELIEKILSFGSHKTTQDNLGKAHQEEQDQDQCFQISEKNIFLQRKESNKEDAINFIGEQLVNLGYVSEEYVEGMHAREKLVSTYLGESIAVPHGTIEAKEFIKHTGILFCQFPNGIKWGDDEEDIANIVIGIAAQGDNHIQILSSITNALDDENSLEILKNTHQKTDVLNILQPNNE